MIKNINLGNKSAAIEALQHLKESKYDSLDIDTSKKTVVISPETTWDNKHWSIENWQEVIENLKDRDGVLKAKTEIFLYMSDTGDIFLNGDDDKLITILGVSGHRTITFFGKTGKHPVRAEKIEPLGLKGTKFEAVTEAGRFSVVVPVPGEHMVLDALAAIAVGVKFGMTSEEIIAGIKKFRPVGGHSNLIETGRFTILDDCYNANPTSMKAGIDVLKAALGRRVAILGDMFELGAEEKSFHASVGAYAAKTELELLVFVGVLSKEGFLAAQTEKKEGHNILWFQTKEELLEKLPEVFQDGDTILVKASHGMHFEKIVAALQDF